jgi:hypothetical protein
MRKATTRFLLLLLLALVNSIPVAAQTAPAPYDVTIVLTGLMSFQHEFDGSGKVIVSSTVIIPKVATSTVGDDGHTVHPHIAYLLSDVQTLQSTGFNSVLNIEKAAFEGNKYHYVQLNGELVSVDDENAIDVLNPQLIAVTNEPGDKICPDSASRTSMYFLSSMKRVTGKTNLVPDPAHFDHLPEPQTIAARLLIRHGQLAAHVLLPGLKWEFKTPVKPTQTPGPATTTQAVAQEVYWTFKARNEPFVLNLLGFKGGSRRVAFTPQGGKLLIVLANTMDNESGPIPTAASEARDDHYSVYHQFVQTNADGKGQIPHRKNDSSGHADLCKDQTMLFCRTLIPTTESCSVPLAPLPPIPAPLHGVNKMGEAHLSSVTPGGQPTPSGLNCAPNSWP